MENNVILQDGSTDFNNESLEQNENLEDNYKHGDEYDNDSSDEEEIRNTIGNVPLEWYNDYPHIGYDHEGKKIIKPVRPDELDKFLKKMNDPNFWRTVKDKMSGQDVVLSDAEIEIIKRIKSSMFASAKADQYEPYEDFFTYETMQHPLRNYPLSKKSFIPSLIEKAQVSKYVHAIKMGWLKRKAPKKTEEEFYDLWGDSMSEPLSKRMKYHIPAPKEKLPGHRYSYNPPSEYLFTPEEEKEFLNTPPEDRKFDIIPKKYSSLRLVPAYQFFEKERFERAMDLHLCPRQKRMKTQVNPEDLIPKLPKPSELRPYPKQLYKVFKGHKKEINNLAVNKSGSHLFSSSNDNTVRIWDTNTGRCVKVFQFEGPVLHVSYCPNGEVDLITAVVGTSLYFMYFNLDQKAILQNTFDKLQEFKKNGKIQENSMVEWKLADSNESQTCLTISHPKSLKKVVWHSKGSYFATLMNVQNKSIVFHGLSSWTSEEAIYKTDVQDIMFHPTKANFFVATKTHLLIYNLNTRTILKTLATNGKWTSSIAVHPGGENVLVGDFDNKISWMDLELSTKPYKTLRYHTKSVRKVAFHKRYPLFASASDDATVVIAHGKVHDDLNLNALIVPVKKLKVIIPNVKINDCLFHPEKPWLFSACTNGDINKYVDR